MHGLQQPPLGVAIQIDEQVAARDEVEPRERGVAQGVVRREQYLLAQFAPDAVAAVLLREEPAQALVADVGRDRQRVHPLARDANRLLVQIRREDLHRRRRGQTRGVLGQQHRDRVRLLAGGARHDPRTQRAVGGLALEQRGNLALERGEALGVAEEVRDADQQVLQQRLGLPRPGSQAAHVVPEVLHLVDLHAARDAANDGRPLVAREVASRPRAQQVQDVAQFLLARTLR